MEPLVSVCCITYNQSAFIEETINGFLLQKTKFPIEIIIHDDASTDGATEIIQTNALKFPKLIFPILQKENQWSKGIRPSSTYVWPRARGKYIALCEGDDYWTDPYKLQKQVDFLETNPEYGMVYTKVRVYNERKKSFSSKDFGEKFNSIEELLIRNYIPTPSVVFRKDLYQSYEKEIRPEKHNWLMGDYPMWIYFASVSKLKFIDYTSAVYRLLEKSISHSKNYKKDIQFLDSYNEIKKFYIQRLQLKHLENGIANHYYSSKARIYLLKNEKKIHSLKKEIAVSGVKTPKIKFIKILISNWILRKILKGYWTIRTNFQ